VDELKLTPGAKVTLALPPAALRLPRLDREPLEKALVTLDSSPLAVGSPDWIPPPPLPPPPPPVPWEFADVRLRYMSPTSADVTDDMPRDCAVGDRDLPRLPLPPPAPPPRA